MQAITIGFDIAKSVFQVHGIDAEGSVIVWRQLDRRHVLAFFHKPPPCLVGIEACIKIADIVPDQIDDMKNFSSTRDSGVDCP